MLKTSVEITSPGQGITVQLFSLRSEADTSRPLFSSSPRDVITHTLKMSGFFFPRGALLVPFRWLFAQTSRGLRGAGSSLSQ